MVTRRAGSKKMVTRRTARVSNCGVLVEAEIKELIANSQLVIQGDSSQVRGCSYDLTVGTIFWQEKVYSAPDTQIVIPPGGVVAILTKEELDLPNDMFATAFAINKMSSRGLLVLNPGHVDPGFKGALTVKALNLRKVPMTLEAGANIFTVIFQRLPRSTTAYPPIAKDRKSRERDFNETTVETSPRTIFEMMVLDRDGPYPSREEVKSLLKDLERDGPFPTREQVKDLIKESRLVWWTFAASLATFIVAVAGLIFAIVAAYKSVYPSNPPAATNHSINAKNELAEGTSPPQPTAVSAKPTPAVPSKSVNGAGVKAAPPPKEEQPDD